MLEIVLSKEFRTRRTNTRKEASSEKQRELTAARLRTHNSHCGYQHSRQEELSLVERLLIFNADMLQSERIRNI